MIFGIGEKAFETNIQDMCGLYCNKRTVECGWAYEFDV